MFLKKNIGILFAAILLCIGLYITYFQIFGFDLKYIIGDLGDSRFINSIIEFNYQYLIGNYDSYWDGFFMYPDKEVISYSDNLIGITPLYALFRSVGNDYLTSYQLTLLLCHILNFISAYYCFYKITGHKIGSAIGAFIFAFNLSANSIHNYPQFTFRFAIPFAFLHLHNYLQTFQKKDQILFGVWLVIQFYLGVYLGYLLLVMILFFFTMSLLLDKRIVSNLFKVKRLLFLLLSYVGILLALLPMFYFYYKRNKLTGYYTDYAVVIDTIPQLKSYIYPFVSANLFPLFSGVTIKTQFSWFHQIFPGLLVYAGILTALIFTIRKKDKALSTVLLTLLLVLVCFTNFNGFSLYQYLQHIPGLRAIRVVSRVILLSTFLYGWIIAMLISKIDVKNKFIEYAFVLIIPVLLYLDNYCGIDGFKRYEKQEALSRVKIIEAKVLASNNQGDSRTFAYIPKSDEEAYKIQIDAMQTAVYMKWKTVNGYSSSCHGNFGPFWMNHDSLSVTEWCKIMKCDMSKIVMVE